MLGTWKLRGVYCALTSELYLRLRKMLRERRDTTAWRGSWRKGGGIAGTSSVRYAYFGRVYFIYLYCTDVLHIFISMKWVWVALMYRGMGVWVCCVCYSYVYAINLIPVEQVQIGVLVAVGVCVVIGLVIGLSVGLSQPSQQEVLLEFHERCGEERCRNAEMQMDSLVFTKDFPTHFSIFCFLEQSVHWERYIRTDARGD